MTRFATLQSWWSEILITCWYMWQHLINILKHLVKPWYFVLPLIVVGCVYWWRLLFCKLSGTWSMGKKNVIGPKSFLVLKPNLHWAQRKEQIGMNVRWWKKESMSFTSLHPPLVVPLFVANETLWFSFPQCNLYSFYEQKMCWKHCSLFVTKDSLLSSQWIVSILRNIEHIVTRVHYSAQFYNLNALVLWANKHVQWKTTFIVINKCGFVSIFCVQNPMFVWDLKKKSVILFSLVLCL